MVLAKMQSEYWAGKKNLQDIESYWSSPPATIRSKWLVEQLKNLQFSSIFEIGYFSGRNLRYITEAFPTVSINGLEINKKAVKFAKEKLPRANLLHMNLHDMYKLNTTYDVAFTSGVLIHVPPDDIPNVLKQCLDLSNRYVLHIESLGRGEVSAGPKHLNPTYKVSDQLQWAPDILSVYRQIGFDPQVIKLPDNCKTNGASELVIIDKLK